MNPLAIIHVIVGLIIIGVSLPLVKRKIKRNQWYGIRIPEAFKSEERWLEINQFGGRLMMRLGFVIAITAGGCLTLPKKYWAIYGLSEVAVILVGLGVVTIFIFRYAARTKKA
jgi:uncharacterized membrane protein